jgi:hypothetical protein
LAHTAGRAVGPSFKTSTIYRLIAMTKYTARTVSVISLACAAFGTQLVHAQTTSSSPTRAQVKAEAVAAAASKPKGEMSTLNQDKGMQPSTSNTTRAAVKAEAIAAAASKPKGEMSTPNQDKGMRPRASNTTREAVKAEIAGSEVPGEGERSQPKKAPAK